MNGEAMTIVASDAPADLARAAMEKVWGSTARSRGLLHWKGVWLMWKETGPDSGRWTVSADEREMRAALWVFLSQCATEEWKDADTQVRTRVRVDKRMVDDVMDAVKGFALFRVEQLPVWINKPQGVEEWECVGFEDVVVNARTGETWPRTREWVDVGSLDLEWGQGRAECPVTDRVVQEWGDSDPAWVEAWWRVMGLTVGNERRLGVIPVLAGLTRGGKGVTSRLVKALKGEAAFMTDIKSLVSEYGLWGAQVASVVVVEEVGKLTKTQAETVGSVIKRVVGRDVVTLNGKWQMPVRTQVSATVVMVGNTIPNLPDHGQAISRKLVVVPFNKSWAGKEDPGLEEKMKAELAGVARKAVEALGRVLREGDSGRKFDRGLGREDLEDFQREVNEADDFLHGCFNKAAGSMVSAQRVLEEYREWAGAKAVSEVEFHRRFMKQTSWGLGKTKRDGRVFYVGLALAMGRVVRE